MSCDIHWMITQQISVRDPFGRANNFANLFCIQNWAQNDAFNQSLWRRRRFLTRCVICYRERRSRWWLAGTHRHRWSVHRAIYLTLCRHRYLCRRLCAFVGVSTSNIKCIMKHPHGTWRTLIFAVSFLVTAVLGFTNSLRLLGRYA